MKLLILLSFLVGACLAVSVELKSLKNIARHVNQQKTTWKANENVEEHLTVDSYKHLLGSKKSDKKLPVRGAHSLPDSAIPKEFDARQEWSNCPTIRQLRDQGSCGSCWAVAAAGAFSDRLCIASNASFTLPLSSLELLSCCGDMCGDGCNGGYPIEAWTWFAEHGLATGGEWHSNVGCQPYSIEACEHHSTGSRPQCDSLPLEDTPRCQKKCTNSQYSVPYAKDHHKVHSAYSVEGVKEIQKELMVHGPLEVAFTVYNDFVTYKSGIYQQTSWTPLGGHAVRLIGWGEENGTPYWLIANSWNSDWGENGTFRIVRGQDECGIESEVVGGVPVV